MRLNVKGVKREGVDCFNYSKCPEIFLSGSKLTGSFTG
jgi:hypothetical protein